MHVKEHSLMYAFLKILTELDRSKSVPWYFFRVIEKKLTQNMYYTIQTQNFQFDVSLTSGP